MSEIIVIFLMLVLLCKGDKYWVSHVETQLLVPHALTGEPEEHTSEVWKSCECRNTYCTCNAEFHGWNNRMLNFTIMNVEHRFRMEVFDQMIENKEIFFLEEGLNCHELKAGVFDDICVKTYGNMTNPYWINICIQMGIIIERHHAITLEYQCFKSDNRSFNHTGIKFESPSLTELNHYMFKYHKTSSAQNNHVSRIIICFLVLFTIIKGMKDS